MSISELQKKNTVYIQNINEIFIISVQLEVKISVVTLVYSKMNLYVHLYGGQDLFTMGMIHALIIVLNILLNAIKIYPHCLQVSYIIVSYFNECGFKKKIIYPNRSGWSLFTLYTIGTAANY